MWLAPDAIAAWEAVGVGKRGGQRQYSDLAIETALTLRLIFHLPLRQTEGFLTSIFGMLGLDLSAPDHTTLSRRGQHLVPTKNLIRTVCVTDRAVLGRRTITSVGMADVRSVEVDGRLASFGRSSGRRVSVHGLQAPAIRGCGQAACRW